MASMTTAPPVAERGKEEDVAPAHPREDLVARQPGRPGDAAGDAKAGGQLFEPRPLRALADELERRRRRRAKQEPQGLEASGRPLMASNRPT